MRGPKPSAELLGAFSYTQVDSGDVTLSTGESLERGSLFVDAVEYIGGRTVRTSYFAKIDDTSLVYDSELDDQSQIFKYDPSPVVVEQNVAGTYNLDFTTSTLTRSDIETLPNSITEGKYFYINSDKTKVYTITRVIGDSATFTPELVDTSVLDAQITLVSNDFLGGLWYVDVRDVDYVGELTNQYKLSAGLTNSAVAQNSPIYTYRDIDTRSDLDRVYRVVLKGFNSEYGLRPPQANYILEASADYNSVLNTDLAPLVLSNVSKISEGEYETILITSDQATAPSVYPLKNLDHPELTENPNTSLSYLAISKLAAYENINLEPQHLIASSTPFNITFKNSSAPFLIELRKPSVIRANSHVWEWVGYLNYDSGLPTIQNNSFDSETYLNKLINEVGGGKIYATGSTEAGEFIMNNRIATDSSKVSSSTSVTQESFLSSQSFPSSFSFEDLRVSASLSMPPFSALDLDTQTTLKVSSSTRILNELGATLDSSNFDYDSYATETSAGFVQLASQTAVNNGVSESTVVTPATLQNKKASDNFYGISKLSTSAEVRQWISTGAGDNPTDVVTNQALGSNLSALTTTSSFASDLWFTLSSTDVLTSVESSSLYVWGSWVSLWKTDAWELVSVPTAQAFNLEDIGATESNTLYNVYAYLDNSDEFKLICLDEANVVEDGIVVASSNKKYRFIGKVYVYLSAGDIKSSITISGNAANVYYANYLRPRSVTLNLILDEDFPTILTSMTDWDSPASENLSYGAGTAYDVDPKISFISAINQNIRAEATLLTSYNYSVANPNQLAEYVQTSVGINLGALGSTSVSNIHSSCFTGTTANRLSTCQASLGTHISAGAYDLVYVFKSTIVGTLVTDIIHNKNLVAQGLHYGLRLTLEA